MRLVAYLTNFWTRLRDGSAQSQACLPAGVDPDWLAWREARRTKALDARAYEFLDEVSLKFARAL